MKANILLVDDDATIRELLGVILRGNYQLSEADSGAALKQAFSRTQPDVILLDIKLPDADGLELLPQIKKQWAETEVIVLTGNATFEAAVEATKRGAYHFLNKPFDTQGLLVTVERALDHERRAPADFSEPGHAECRAHRRTRRPQRRGDLDHRRKRFRQGSHR